MARRRHGRVSGRPVDLNNRVANRTLAAQAPGDGFHRRSHADKKIYPRFCDALRQERLSAWERVHVGQQPIRRKIYPCQYGDHWLIDTAPRHWHIGRASDSL